MLTYHTFIVRCWQENESSKMSWRFILERPENSQRKGFTATEPLLNAMRGELEQLTDGQLMEKKEEHMKQLA